MSKFQLLVVRFMLLVLDLIKDDLREKSSVRSIELGRDASLLSYSLRMATEEEEAEAANTGS